MGRAGATGVDDRRRRGRARLLCAFSLATLAALSLATFAVLVLLGPGAQPAGAVVTPDSACGSESSSKSTSGTTTANLTIINNTGEGLQSFWLDYDGKRVLYKQVAPFTSYVQPTWVTHPWIVTNAQGACYRFVIMNSVAQTVTVNPDAGPPQQTATPPSSVPRGSPPGGGSQSADRAQQSAEASGSGSDQGSGFPTLPVVGVVAVVLAAIGGLAATGHLPGLGGSSGTASAPAPGVPAVDPSAVELQQTITDALNNPSAPSTSAGTQARNDQVLRDYLRQMKESTPEQMRDRILEDIRVMNSGVDPPGWPSTAPAAPAPRRAFPPSIPPRSSSSRRSPMR